MSGKDSFDSPHMGSYWLPIDTYGLSLTVLELYSWLQMRFRPPARPPDPDTMTSTTLEAAASSGGKTIYMQIMKFQQPCHVDDRNLVAIKKIDQFVRCCHNPNTG